MRSRIFNHTVVGIALTAAITFSAPGARAQTTSDPTQARAIAKAAYIYAYAPVYIERQRRNMISADKDMGDGRAPENTFSWVRELATPALKTIVMPNNDTLYGSAWIDLSYEPFILSMPDIGNRYFTFQFMDAFSNTFAYVGTRATGPHGGRFLVAGPGWQGKAPDGLSGVVNSPTSRIWLVARFGVNGTPDLAAAHALQDAVILKPISGKPAAIQNPRYAPLPPPEKLPAMQFFAMFGDVLKAYPSPAPAMELVKSFSVIALDASNGFSPDRLSPEVKAAVEDGAKDGFAAIEQAKLGDSVNGWDFSMKNGRFGEDYLVRSAIAYRSLAGNVPEEAIYFNANKDSSGKPLDGARRYQVRFEKGQLPPVGAFWSLTMYDGNTFFLVDNPINRYAIGDRSPGLKYADDGSLTLYIQHNSPGGDREGNWLPAPEGAFDVHLRTYIPRPALMDGRYKLPPIQQVN